MGRKQIIVYTDNHFDPMWRRCFKKRIEHKGDTFISYSEIEEYYIFQNLKMAEKYPDYSFQVETVFVLRNFLLKHPELSTVFQRLYQEGRFYVPGSGYCIIDSNLSSGESLIRNFSLGNLWLTNFLGKQPRLCVRNDAFGNSPQMPQIMKGVGYVWTSGLSYVDCDSCYWKGLDGTVIYKNEIPTVGFSGSWIKYAPCPVCHGTGRLGEGRCEACDGKGVDFEKAEPYRSDYQINDDAFGQSELGFFHVGSEELIPKEDLMDWVDSASKEYDIRFGNQESFYDKIQDEILKANDPAFCDQLPMNGDLNPVTTGCYVTRMRTKQNVRRAENRLAALEGLEAMAYVRTGKCFRPYFREIWDDLFFTMFHDAITGTHVDAAYEELMEVFDQVEENCDRVKEFLMPKKEKNFITLTNATPLDFSGLIDVSVPSGTCITVPEEGDVQFIKEEKENQNATKVTLAVRNLKAFSKIKLPTKVQEVQGEVKSEANTHAVQKSTSAVLSNPLEQYSSQDSKEEIVSIENDNFRIEADDHGITRITDLKKKMVICEASKYRPCEFVLRQDIGSPWATLCKSEQEISLSEHTRLVGVVEEKNRKALLFHTELPMYLSTAIHSTVVDLEISLVEGLPHVEFSAQVEWHNFNNRLCVVFPTSLAGKHLYEVPYGYIERKEYTPQYGWTGADGHWAAANWSGIDAGHYSVALFNQGIPANQIMTVDGGSVLQLSLLRSPTVPTYLHESLAYSMTDWDGMRDEGNFRFRFALKGYEGHLSDSSVVTDAQCFNTQLIQGETELVSMPILESMHSRISAVKVSEEEDGVVLRIVEYAGQSESITLKLPDWVKSAFITDMMEQNMQELSVDDHSIRLSINPFQIITLKIVVRE